MSTYHLTDEIMAVLIIIAGLLAARPVLNWLLVKLYNMFIGTGHY